MLSSGSLDERIFLGEAAREDIGTPGPCLCEGIENQERPSNTLQNSLTVCVTYTQNKIHMNFLFIPFSYLFIFMNNNNVILYYVFVCLLPRNLLLEFPLHSQEGGTFPTATSVLPYPWQCRVWAACTLCLQDLNSNPA